MDYQESVYHGLCMILSPCRLPARRDPRPRGAVGAEDDRDWVGWVDGWLCSLE